MLLHKKFFIVFFIVLSFTLFLNINPVKAFTVDDVSYPDIPEFFISQFDSHLIFENSGRVHLCSYNQTEVKVFLGVFPSNIDYKNSILFDVLKDNIDLTYNVYLRTNTDGVKVWSYVGCSSNCPGIDNCSFCQKNCLRTISSGVRVVSPSSLFKKQDEALNSVIYCTTNIYDSSGNVLLPLIPLVVAVHKAEEVTPMNQVLVEILKIIPLILVVVVSFLGLRKALQMLLTLLRKS